MTSSVPPISGCPESAPCSVNPASSAFRRENARFELLQKGDDELVIRISGDFSSEENARDLNQALDQNGVKDRLPMHIAFDLTGLTGLDQDGSGPIVRVYRWWLREWTDVGTFEIRFNPDNNAFSRRLRRILGDLPATFTVVGSA
jgi:hypothetical protein